MSEELFIGDFKTIDVVPLWTHVKSGKRYIKRLNDEVKAMIEQLRHDPNKAVILESFDKPRFIVRFYRSKTYEPLRRGMYYIYLATERKIVVGGFSRIRNFERSIKELEERYGNVSTCWLVEVTKGVVSDEQV